MRDRLVEKKGFDLHFNVSNQEVFDRIAADPRFREGDRFSLDVYKNLLRQAGISEPAFEDSIRRQILAERVVDPIARGGIVPRVTAAEFVSLVEQQREVEYANIDIDGVRQGQSASTRRRRRRSTRPTRPPSRRPRKRSSSTSC